jgi:cyclase
MWLPRIIPSLLLDGNGLVKTRKFKDPTYVGDPINAIKIFNDKRVDELIFLDISASKARREPNYRLIEKIASECFMPVCYGGGVNSVIQARKIIELGIEKVSLNSAVIEVPGLVSEISAELGSQSVVASVDIKKSWTGRYRVYDSARGKLTQVDPLEHIARLVEAGAGEVFINNVDADGMQSGFDIPLVRAVSAKVSVPVIACGGAGSLEHIKAAIRDGGASAAAAGSIFVFKGPHRAVLISYPTQSQIMELLG